MTDADSNVYARRAAPRTSPERVRATCFARTPIGRRGLNEEEVHQFLQRMAEEIAARDAAEASLRAEVSYYKNRLMQWQTERRQTGVDEAVPPRPEPSLEAITILSRAQQEADAYVAQAQDYCRRMTDDARTHAQAMLAEAQAQAERAAEQAVRDYRARAGDGYAAELEELERRLAWTRTFLTSLESVETQLRSAREALSYEVEKLADSQRPASDAPPAAPAPGVPAADDQPA